MHLPDGFLSLPVSGAMAIASVGAVGAALWRVSEEDGTAAPARSLTPLMGVTAAFVFAAQMFNFPVAGGTTGHLLGASLASLLLGPWRAVLVMTAVLVIQAFVFQDGGLLALGANVFNLAVFGSLLSSLVLATAGRLAPGRRGRLLGLAVAAWVSVVLASGLVAVELAASGTVPLRVVLPAMLSIHAVIGLGEAVLSVAAANLLLAARPDLVREGACHGRAEGWRIAAVLILGLVIVRLACPSPDGLAWIAEQLGFAARAQAGFAAAPLPDYAVRGRSTDGFDWLGSYLSAGLGMLLCAGAMLTLGGARPGWRRRSRPA